MITFQKNRITIVGLATILLSTILFLIPELPIDEIKLKFFTEGGTVLIHYVIALAFAIYAKVENLRSKKKFFEHNRETGTLTGILFWISCFALNRDIAIFHESTAWLSWLITICSITYLVEVFFTFSNKYLLAAYAFLYGITTALLLYYTVYLLPMWGFGLLGMILIGIGGHVFVPFFMFLNQIRLIEKLYTHTYTSIGYTLGLITPVVSIIIFAIIFNASYDRFQQTVSEGLKQTELPAWVYISKNTTKSTFNNLILRKAVIYPFFRWEFEDLPSQNKQYEKRHNPALVFADMLKPSNRSLDKLSMDDRINILASDYEEHNEQEERLWRGNDLTTEKIKTEVELFPTYRLAYTEKTFWIKNNSNPKYRWNNQQEAIYTFHMPEGTVVTSLSLWVNGKEEKGILTSKKKAEQAYNTIVGRERRDPSLVTWKEGNMITARVFPCTPSENRQVKIGFTSPLAVRNNTQYYQSLQFEGPYFKDTEEEIIIHKPEGFEPVQIGLNKVNETLYYKGDYQDKWNLVSQKQAISKNAFCFDNNCYTLSPIKKEAQTINKVYIDITKDWSEQDIKSLLSANQGKNLFYFINNRLQIIASEKDIVDAMEYGKSIRFSLFPFHLIDNNNSLVLTKGGSFSTKWSHLKKSYFENSIRQWIKTGNTSNVALFGSQLTPYQKGLLEFKALNLMQLSLDEIIKSLENNAIQVPAKQKNSVNIYQSEICIKKTPNRHKSSKAPDHLMRLYAYNDIMGKAIGFKDDDSKLEELVDIAKTAYVVSPVSSLIVLETQQDYENHDIKDKKNSLHNASISSSGAAPGPHEWMMIIMTSLLALYVLYKKFNYKFSI